MCTVLLPLGVNPIAVTKYFNKRLLLRPKDVARA